MIKVNCEVQMFKIEDIKPYRRNPRKNDKTVEFLCNIIKDIGFNVPLVIDKKQVIIKGHSRYCAAVKLGMEELPCIVSKNGVKKNNKDRLTDNRASELSEWDIDKLKYEIDTFDFDIDDILKEVDNTYRNIVQTEKVVKKKSKKPSKKKKEQYIEITCKKCGEVIYIDTDFLEKMKARENE